MIGMVLVGSLMGVPFAFANRITSIQKIFKYPTGIFSFAIGINIMYQVGILGHLFNTQNNYLLKEMFSILSNEFYVQIFTLY